jgi:endonuclease YncB( thermonuclease family)
MDEQESVAQVIRVTRGDTLLVRTACPQLQSKVSLYMVLEGIRAKPEARGAVLDWVELHADAERLKLVSIGWVRDEYGRLLGDLADIQTGELLTDWLIETGAAEPYEHHYLDVMENMLRSQEPEL